MNHTFPTCTFRTTNGGIATGLYIGDDVVNRFHVFSLENDDFPGVFSPCLVEFDRLRSLSIHPETPAPKYIPLVERRDSDVDADPDEVLIVDWDEICDDADYATDILTKLDNIKPDDAERIREFVAEVWPAGDGD